VLASKNVTVNKVAFSLLTGTQTAVTTALAGPQAAALGETCGPAEGAIALLISATKRPVLCCGTDSFLMSTIYMNPAGTSKYGSKKDIYFVNLLGEAGNIIEGTIIKNDNKEQRKIDEMTTLIAYNAVYENASEEILNSNLSKEEKLRKMAC